VEDAVTAPFDRMFAAQFGFVWGSLRRLGVQVRDVEDVAQEVFVQVYRKLDRFDPDRPIRPWLFGFAVRAASDYRKLARHRIDLVGGDLPEGRSNVPSPQDAILEKDQNRLVEQALESIPLERRAVLIAFELDEQPMKEIADALEIPLFTAYSRLRVAREEFKKAVQRVRAERMDDSNSVRPVRRGHR
jgi:RNA polymerase sigma-70 factor (ECF subfamily)